MFTTTAYPNNPIKKCPDMQPLHLVNSMIGFG